MLALVPSGARVAGTFLFPTPVTAHVERYSSGVFQLTVSAAATGVGDTLNAFVQSSADGGATWDDFASFTQVLGNGGPQKRILQWARESSAPETENRAPSDAALAAGVLQGPVGNLWRVKAVIVGGTASFTFLVAFEGRR